MQSSFLAIDDDLQSKRMKDQKPVLQQKGNEEQNVIPMTKKQS